MNRAERALKVVEIGSVIGVVVMFVSGEWQAALCVHHAERENENFPLNAIGFRYEGCTDLARFGLMIREFMLTAYVQNLLPDGAKLAYVNVTIEYDQEAKDVSRDRNVIANIIYRVVPCG